MNRTQSLYNMALTMFRIQDKIKQYMKNQE